MLWLPTARRAPITGQPGFAWQVDCPTKGVIHTTEGGNNVPSYLPGLKAPHATILVRPGAGVDVVQHIPFNLASYSLMHPAGTAPTNGAHTLQFELCGTSELGGPGYYWPNADSKVLTDLWVKVIKPVNDAFGVQLVAPSFKAYPASYGSANGVRLSGAEFTAWKGWLGHQHVPGNQHGDPGLFPWARLAAIAAADTHGDDMPTPEDIAKAVWSHPVTARWNGKDEPADVMLARAEQYAIEGSYYGKRPAKDGKDGAPTRALDVAQQLAAIRQQVTDLAAAVAKLQPTPPVPPAQATAPDDDTPGRHEL